MRTSPSAPIEISSWALSATGLPPALGPQLARAFLLLLFLGDLVPLALQLRQRLRVRIALRDPVGHRARALVLAVVAHERRLPGPLVHLHADLRPLLSVTTRSTAWLRPFWSR